MNFLNSHGGSGNDYSWNRNVRSTKTLPTIYPPTQSFGGSDTNSPASSSRTHTRFLLPRVPNPPPQTVFPNLSASYASATDATFPYRNYSATSCVSSTCITAPRSSLKNTGAPRLISAVPYHRPSILHPTPITESKPTTQESNTNKEPKGKWITSGREGSRDAVLVFRADILNYRFKELNNPIPKPKPLQSAKASTNINKSALNQEDRPNDTMRAAYSCQKNERAAYSCRKKERAANSCRKNERAANSCRKNERAAMKQPVVRNTMIMSRQRAQAPRTPITITTKYGLKPRPARPKEPKTTTEGEVESENEECLEDCVYKENMPASELKITYKFAQTETRLLRRIFIKHGLTEALDENSFNILWTGMHMRPDILRQLTPYQRVNHFPRSFELTRKDRLYKNVECMQHMHGSRHFDLVPKSFMIPGEYKELLAEHNKYRGYWIVKPAASSRGRGIYIVTAPEQIPQDEQVIVSKYVNNPLLIDGHKCDVRLYVLVTSFDPLMIYVYEEGLVRLATVKYEGDIDNLWNPCMHLCNYSINKYHTDYISSNDPENEDVGHKWTFSALLRHLRSTGCNTGELMTNIEDLIIKSLFSCSQTILSACRMFMQSGSNCFELYGFDILIDNSLKPWLLEINLAPSMNVDSPLDAKVKSCLMVDVLTCVGIPAYSPTMRAHIDASWFRFRGMSNPKQGKSDEGLLGRPFTNKDRRDKFALTSEEQRFVREARLQDARRGGLVRIFPTEETWQKYYNFLDPLTGVPLSTTPGQTQATHQTVFSHNYNRILNECLYGGDTDSKPKITRSNQRSRMMQYERTLEVAKPITFLPREVEDKSLETARVFRKRILSLFDEGLQLTHRQVRQLFYAYLAAVKKRLTTVSTAYHDKLLLKFLMRVGMVTQNLPEFDSSQTKARSAMVAKVLQDYLENYLKISETYIDCEELPGMMPLRIFKGFLEHSHEADLEAVLIQLTRSTNSMPYLYNRWNTGIPEPPPIPSGMYGFLKSLPSMALPGAGIKDTGCVCGRFQEFEIAGYRSHPTKPGVIHRS